MFGVHPFGTAYYAQGPRGVLDIIRKKVRAIGVYVRCALATAVHVIKATARGQG